MAWYAKIRTMTRSACFSWLSSYFSRRRDAPHLSDQPVAAVVVLVLVLVVVVEGAVVEFGDDATVPMVGSSRPRPRVDEKIH